MGKLRLMTIARSIARLALVTLLAATSSLGCIWEYPIWIPHDPTADPLYRFVVGNKVGYINQDGKVITRPTLPPYEDKTFHDGLLEIGSEDGVYIDASGKKAIHKKFFRGWDFSEGLAVAMEKEGGEWGYINTQGEFEISPRFKSSQTDYVWPFKGGFAQIEVEGRFGYIDHKGEFAIQPRFLDGDSFHDGMARVIVDGPCSYIRIPEESPCPNFGVLPPGTKDSKDLPACKYTFIDASGNIISNQRYDYALPFAEGLAPVQINKLWGYVDKKGAIVIAPRFSSAASFSDGVGLVSEKGLFGYIDRTGAYVIKPEFKHAESFAEGRAVVADEKSGFRYIDHSGHEAFPGKFVLASRFFKGLAHVKIRSATGELKNRNEGEFAYIDYSGKEVFTYEQ